MISVLMDVGGCSSDSRWSESSSLGTSWDAATGGLEVKSASSTPQAVLSRDGFFSFTRSA